MSVTVTYWDGRGNAEIIRMMLSAAGYDWKESVPNSEAQNLGTPGDVEALSKAGLLPFDQVV